MHKIFYLLAVLTIFNGMSGAQTQPLQILDGVYKPERPSYPKGGSCITMWIFDTTEASFLDTVESKLLNEISEHLQEGKIMSYYVNPSDGADWRTRLTKHETENKKLPKERIPTNKYEMAIGWDSVLNSGFILGFSKEYYYKDPDEYSSGTVICSALYHVPLIEYKAFLNQTEISKLNRLIKKYFIRYVNDESSICGWSFRDTSTYSCRILDFNKSDSFVLMPLSYWGSQFEKWINDGELWCYKDAYCNERMTHSETGDILYRIDTVTDENGNQVTVRVECGLPSVAVVEKWEFDTLSNNPGNYALKINRQIISMGISGCSTMYVKSEKRIWFTYYDIDGISKHQGFRYYKEQLDNALFKKLNLEYLR
jgi:hypothetical protein